jgi:hypothetical protein
VPLAPFLEPSEGAEASLHASAVGTKFPVGDLKHLTAAAYARRRTRIAYASESSVATRSINLTKHTATDWTTAALLVMVLSSLRLSEPRIVDRA